MEHDLLDEVLDEGDYTFDKFMDSILLSERRVRQEDAPVMGETPQRRLNRRGRESPVNRTVYAPRSR